MVIGGSDWCRDAWENLECKGLTTLDMGLQCSCFTNCTESTEAFQFKYTKRLSENSENMSLNFYFCKQLVFKITFHLQRPEKNRFFFYLEKLSSNIKPDVSIIKYLKSLKAPKLFRKTYFKIKVNKSGRYQNLEPGWIPWARSSCYYHILFTSCTLQNSRVEALYLWGKKK